ncbi:ATM interactor [Halotydeus destructor]|nr:ATM interactor [Halotydeus destructor]
MELICPHMGCSYADGGGKVFKTKANMKQHLANMHDEKEFICSLCTKSFAFDWQLRSHLKACGKQWKCHNCGKLYSERLSLVKHCKRKSHQLPEEAIFRGKKPSLQPVVYVLLNPVQVAQQAVSIPFTGSLKERSILPKVSDGQTVECSTQTDQSKECDCKQTKSSTAVSKRSFKTQSGTQTETKSKSNSSRGAQCLPIRKSSRKRIRSHLELGQSIETQTNESVLSSKQFKSVQTRTQSTLASQTKKPTKTSVTVETLTDIQRPVSPLLYQFNPFLSQSTASIMTSSDKAIGVQTELADLSQFAEIETQTAEQEQQPMERDDCSELFLEFELNDNETQTTWNADCMTQTDEFSEIDVDFVLRELFSGGLEQPNVRSTETETQTQLDWDNTFHST